jgi:hypothetical protein
LVFGKRIECRESEYEYWRRVEKQEVRWFKGIFRPKEKVKRF